MKILRENTPAFVKAEVHLKASELDTR